MAYGFNEDKTKANIEEIADDMAAGKVDSVAGKVLSDNNYTTAAKNIVNGIPTALAGKVDKVTGKGLSTNDFTNAYKTKVDEAAFNNFSDTEAEVLASDSNSYYSASNPFICPHDGYIRQRQPDAFYGGIPVNNIYIKMGSTWINKSTNYLTMKQEITFVKKGARVYASIYPPGGTATYFPMTSST